MSHIERMNVFAGLLALSFLAVVSGAVNAQQPTVESSKNKVYEVSATAETQPMPNPDEAADDSAVWLNRSRPSASTIIGTDKSGGLAVYDLRGRQIQYLPDGKMNNVDIRYHFPLAGSRVALVTAGNRTDNTIGIYRVNPKTRMLENVAARKIITLVVYGSCMYRSRNTGKYYYFVNSKAGQVEQWQLFGTRTGRVDARKLRTFEVGSQTEGCVADDETGRFYIGEENVGIWKYEAEPTAGNARTQVDKTRAEGPLVSNVEGLTLTYGKNGTGYLIASSQGDSTFVIYRRDGHNQFVKKFRIVDGKAIDGVSETDGIDVTTANLGSAFPHGVFITQDGHNDGNQNFKLVPLQSIIRNRESRPTVSKRNRQSVIRQAWKPAG